MKIFRLIFLSGVNMPRMSCIFIILLGLLFSYCSHLEEDESYSAKYIYVKSTPSAKVFVNGTLIGVTPAYKIAVESGSLIELKAEGYETGSIKLGEVSTSGLTVKSARGHGGISISDKGLEIRMKKQE